MTKAFKKKFKIWKGEVVDRRIEERKNYLAAPSAGVGIMKIYKQLLKKAIRKKKNFRALVLGATPESRDLVLSLRGELVTVDISWEMIEKASSLMKYQNSPKEIIVKANWLNNPIKDNYFDVILGDGVTLHLSWRDQSKFFKELRHLLKRRGFVILREAVINPERKIRTLEEIDSDFRKSRIHQFDASIDYLLYSEISSKVYNSKTGLYDTEKFVKKLNDAYLKRRISKKSKELGKWYKGSGGRTIWSKPKSEKLFERYFRLIPTEQAKDFKFTQDTFIFFFGQNKK